MNEEDLKLTDEDILDLSREYGQEDQVKVKESVKEMIQAHQRELEQELAKQNEKNKELEL